MIRSLMSDAERAFLSRLFLDKARGGGSAVHRLSLDGVFWIARTGLPWRNLPDYSWKMLFGLSAIWPLGPDFRSAPS